MIVVAIVVAIVVTMSHVLVVVIQLVWRVVRVDRVNSDWSLYSTLNWNARRKAIANSFH